MEVFGDVLLEQQSDMSFSNLKKLIERPFVKPRFRLSVLTPYEAVDYVIPEEDIIIGGVNYTESYQNGQRRNISIELVNSTGKYTPNVNGIWVNTKFRFDVGLGYGDNPDDVIWFPKGIYILGNVDLSRGDSEKTVTLQLQDKYALFEGKTGTLDVAYEVQLDSDIIDAVKGVLNFTLGNGYILDYKEPIFDPSFIGMKTQQTIRAEAGENYGTVIDALATQLSAEYYYNSVGNLCFYPLNETVDDSVKPIIWTYPWLGRDLHNLSLNFQNENIVNCVKVIGDNIDSNVYSAVVSNENPTSPICIQQIGRRMDFPDSNANVWSDDLAHDLAMYYLRKSSFVAVQFQSNVSFNPILTVNNICEVEDQFLDLKRNKLLITSISYTSENGQMSVSFCNTEDLPSNTRQKV